MDFVNILPTHIVPYVLIFHAYIDKNRIDTFCFKEKSFNLDKIENKNES